MKAGQMWTVPQPLLPHLDQELAVYRTTRGGDGRSEDAHRFYCSIHNLTFNVVVGSQGRKNGQKPKPSVEFVSL